MAARRGEGGVTHQCRVLPGADPTAPPLILLHGSDGSEGDLVPLADRLSPASTKLAVRGTVSLPGGHAFFRRHQDRRVDEGDLADRLPALHDLVVSMRGEIGDRRLVAVGFSNGAIMAAAMLMMCPHLLSGAILFRPLSPFASPPTVQLDRVPVLALDGTRDERRAAGDGARLARELRDMGAAVTHEELPVGHAITEQDERTARAWLRSAIPDL